MATLDLIDSIMSGQTRNSETIFADLVQTKVEDAIEYRKMEIAQDMFAEAATTESEE